MHSKPTARNSFCFSHMFHLRASSYLSRLPSSSNLEARRPPPHCSDFSTQHPPLLVQACTISKQSPTSSPSSSSPPPYLPSTSSNPPTTPSPKTLSTPPAHQPATLAPPIADPTPTTAAKRSQNSHKTPKTMNSAGERQIRGIGCRKE